MSIETLKKLKKSQTGQGLPLVFIHGWGVNSGVWQSVAETLAASFEVTTIDLPGFGDNAETVLSEYSLQAVVDKIVLSMDKPAIYIGWSLGGLIASRLALTYPEKVVGLVSIASSPCFIENENWPGIKPKVLSGFHQLLSVDTKKTIDNFLKIQAMGSPHIRQDIKKIRDFVMQYPVPTKQTLDQSLNLLESEDLRSSLGEIKVPFFRMYGKLDSLVPISIMDHLLSLHSESESYVFEKASHAPFISHEAEFIDTLTSWLNKNFVSI